MRRVGGVKKTSKSYLNGSLFFSRFPSFKVGFLALILTENILKMYVVRKDMYLNTLRKWSHNIDFSTILIRKTESYTKKKKFYWTRALKTMTPFAISLQNSLWLIFALLLWVFSHRMCWFCVQTKFRYMNGYELLLLLFELLRTYYTNISLLLILSLLSFPLLFPLSLIQHFYYF